MEVKDFIQDFRYRLGDSANSVPEPYIISYLNTALRRLARQEGLQKLFLRRDTFELASINKDGTSSAAWDLGNIGTLLDIPNLKLLSNGGNGVHKLCTSYMEYDDFFNTFHVPEQECAGDPSYYTIEQLGVINRLLFDRPPKDLVAADMRYAAFHPALSTPNDQILIAYSYCDVLLEYALILHKIETTDMATARALYEDLDTLTADLIELLAKQKTGLPYRRVRRSF